MCLLAMSLQCKRPRFNPWVRKIPWRREWLSGPVFLPGEFQGQRSLMGYRPWGHKDSDRTEQLLLSLDHLFVLFREMAILLLFSCPVMSDSATAWTAVRQASLSLTISWYLPKFISIESVVPSNNVILCSPLLLLPSVFPSIRVFSNELSVHIRWPKYWSFSFSISPSKEYSGFNSFKIYWFALLTFQGTLKSLPQHHSLKAYILWHSTFFIVQLSHFMSIGKTIALTIWTLVGKVTFLLFNTLSRFVIAFLPRSNHLILWVAIHSDFRAHEEELYYCFHLFAMNWWDQMPWS